MAKTYNNAILEQEVSLAIENILVAPTGTSWTPSRTDVGSPPAGFKHLGAVVEDSPSLTVTREKFQLRTGVPKVLQYEAIMGVDGKFSLALYSNSPRKVQYALGNYAPINEVTGITTITSATQSQISVTSAAGLAVNCFIVTAATSPGLLSSDNEAKVVSISGTTIYFASNLPNTPAANDNAAKVTSVKVPFGGAAIRKFAVIGIADFTDGVQIAHYFPKVGPASEYTEVIKPDDVGKIMLAFDAYSFVSSVYGGTTENLVGERYWFPPA